MNSKLSLIWGTLIFVLSAILFNVGANSEAAAFYMFISLFCGIFLVVFRNDIPVFSPIFMLVSSIYLNIGFPALYFFLNKAPFSEEMLKNISIIYLVYFFAMILPVFFANQMFIPQKVEILPESQIEENDSAVEADTNKKPGFLNFNFNPLNINIYLWASSLLLAALVVLLLQLTGHTYLDALKNPLAFRHDASAGYFAYIRKLIFLLFMINTFIIAKYKFMPKELFFSKSLVKTGFIGFIHILLLIIFGIISGSRSIFLLPVLSSIAIFSFYNRISLKNIFSLSLLLVVTLYMMNFYEAYRNTAKFHFSFAPMSKVVSGIDLINAPLKRLDSFKNSLSFFQYIDREYNTLLYFKDFHIGEQMKNHIFQPLPASIIPYKGRYFSSCMTEKVFNSDISSNPVTYNFGGISNAFWDLGMAGVAIEGLFLGIAVVWLHRRFLQYINYDGFFLFFMVTFFFIPNSVIVDGFWNTMDGCGYLLNLLITGIIVFVLKISAKTKTG